MAKADGAGRRQPICLVRANSDEEARRRVDKTFDSGDPQLLRHFPGTGRARLQVTAGDKGEANLGLDQQSWQRLADTVDLIVDSYAIDVLTANVGDQIEPSAFTEDADIRVISPPAPSTAATSTATAPASGPARCCCARPTTVGSGGGVSLRHDPGRHR